MYDMMAEAQITSSPSQEEHLYAGFFHLDLRILKKGCTDLDDRLKSLRGQLRGAHPATRSALLNLIGIALYARGDYQEAVDAFSAVLNKDETNLNANYHLAKSVEKLGQVEESESYRSQASNDGGNASFEGGEASFEGENASFEGENASIEGATANIEGGNDAATGKMLLEQAYACTFESYTKETPEKYQRAIELYHRGLDIVQQKLSAGDQVEWKICLGVTYHKLLNILFKLKFKKTPHGRNAAAESATLVKTTYSSAIEVFHSACEQAIGMDSEAMCWSYLGQLLSKRPANAHRDLDQEFLESRGLQLYFCQPELCFKKALELKPGYKEASCRYALHLIREKDPQEALEVIDEVFLTRQPDINWFVYMVRAEARLKCYESEPTPANKEAYLRPTMADITHARFKDNKQIFARIKEYLDE